MDVNHEQRLSRLICLALVLGTLAAYGRVLTCGFTNYDDPAYITENIHVEPGLSASGVEWAFTTGHASNWHPLTWISHMADCQIFGLRPAGHHAVNLLFHLTNTLLLFGVLKRMTGAMWRSACVAALFAWHPLHVESVAWLSERKDVLSAFFWLLTMGAYACYVAARAKQIPVASEVRKHYVLTLIFFVLGLLCKPMLVTLPFALLLLDYWPLRRILVSREMGATASGAVPLRQALLEKAPMMALAVVTSIITFLVQQRGGTVSSLETLPLSERTANAVVAYVRYLTNLFWPHDLSIYYPFQHGLAVWQWGGAAVILAFISMAALAWRQRYPYFITGWLWYLGTLVPVIGLVQVGMQAMADRYTYLPLIGIFIAIAWGATEAIQRLPQLKKPAFAVGGLVLAACLTLTVVQIGYWQDSKTLFKHAIAVTKNNSLAHVNLGEAYDKEGKNAEARAEFEQALAIDPDAPGTLNGLGAVYAHGGDAANAVKYFQAALKKRPSFGDAHYNLGNVLAAEGNYPQAAEQYFEAVKLKPDSPDAHNNLGAMLVKLGRLDEAVDEFKAALRANPNFAEAEDELGGVLAKLGQADTARTHYAEAVRLKPDFVHARLKLGLLEARAGQIDFAINNFLVAVRVEPTNADAHFNLAAAYAAKRDLNNAASEFDAATRLNPADADGWGRLAGVLNVLGRHAEAVRAYREAIRRRADWAAAMHDLAWILATNPNAELRNGAEALRLAQTANELTDNRDPNMLAALDTAYAEVGRFDDAIKTAEKVQQLATNAAQAKIAGQAAKRVELYRAGKAFHE